MSANCKHVSPECPVSDTLYGDHFTLPATAAFAAIFGLMLVAQLFLAWKARLWSFGAWLFCGTAFECIGYVFRSIMVNNPWNDDASIGQNIALVLGPTFVAAAISLTFKHLVIWHGPEFSLMKPRLYPVVFVGSDVVSILIQSAGGGIAAAADTPEMSDIGANMLLAGVTFQVVNMIFCGLLILAYAWRRKKALSEGPIQMSQAVRESQKRVKVFVIALAVAYTAILCRCIYRIPEMAMGWGSSLMRNEATFMTFDGGFLIVACGTLTIFHPAFWFNFMSNRTDKILNRNSDIEMSVTEGIQRTDTSERNERATQK
ncbi:RTA1-domain-containing protein [Sarocladium strictum]